MISTQAADDFIRSHLTPAPTERIPTAQAAGRILRQTILADRDLPPFDRVTMDGIAIHHAAWERGQRRFKIEATAAAGHPPPSLTQPDTHCIQVMTGAILPEGTDCILPYEVFTLENETATLPPDLTPEQGQYIHPQASDRQQGDHLLTPGIRLRSVDISVIVSAGYAEIDVARLPSIALISNGDELIDLGHPLERWHIRPSNTYGLEAGLHNAGFQQVKRLHWNDQETEIREGLTQALAEYDILILSGGVSMGKYDFIPGALAALNVEQVFHKIRQRPGKPFWFGVSPEGKPVFALPGNPAATLVCFHRYVLPHLEHSLGATASPFTLASFSSPITPPSNLTFFPPVRRIHDSALCKVELITYNGSGDLASLAAADGFIECPPDADLLSGAPPLHFYPWRV